MTFLFVAVLILCINEIFTFQWRTMCTPSQQEVAYSFYCDVFFKNPSSALYLLMIKVKQVKEYSLFGMMCAIQCSEYTTSQSKVSQDHAISQYI